jgi:hypothetical protein
MLINTSLLRERFVLQDTGFKEDPMIALGNRILLPLNSQNGQLSERLVIRAHSMHMALRMAARLTQSFYEQGPLINRQIPIDWKSIWYDITTDFERPQTPETWICIYHQGKIVYQEGHHHPFLDVIEKCDVKNRAEYDNAINIAEDIFKQQGKMVKIDHDVNIGVVIGVMEDQTRCGLVLRSPKQTTTFNFHIKDKGKKIHPHTGFDLAADLLEGIQLSVTAGFAEGLLDSNEIGASSPMAKKMQASFNRIGRLTKAINSYNNLYNIRYRTEQPDFKAIMDEARGQRGE